MSYLASIATALPRYKADNHAIIEAAQIWLKDNPEEFEVFKRFLSSSKTDTRYFVVPPEDIVNFTGQEQRSKLFEAEVPLLAGDAVRKAIKSSGIAPKDIDALIFTSCSCPLIPAADTFIIEEFGLRRDVVRIPSYQFGCAGGIIGLGLANRCNEALKNTLVVSAELCSLVFQRTNHSASNLVGAAIFGDGAAAATLTSEKRSGFQIIDHQSYLLPETRHLMGYEIRDTGSHLRLDKDLPSHLVKEVPILVDNFLKKNKVNRKDIPWWLFHPGGTKILKFLDEVLELAPTQSHYAGDILRSIGNLSSATILFVLEHFLSQKEYSQGDPVVLVGVGPGLTIELILGRCGSK